MCGKPNSAEAEVCQYCQAQIKPLGSPFNWDSDDATGSDLEWPQAPSQQKNNADAEGVPDWLQRLRERKQAEKGEPEEDSTTKQLASAEIDADLQDEMRGWLDRLEEETGISEDTEESSFLLDRLREIESEPDEEMNTPFSSGSSPFYLGTDDEQDDAADWLKDLGGDSIEEEEEEEEEPDLKHTELITNRLRSAFAEESEQSEEEDAADWLKDLSGVSIEEEEEESDLKHTELITNRLRSAFAEESEQPEKEGDDNLDWLSGLEPESSEAAEEPVFTFGDTDPDLKPTEVLHEGEVPGWLSEIAGHPSEEETLDEVIGALTTTDSGEVPAFAMDKTELEDDGFILPTPSDALETSIEEIEEIIEQPLQETRLEDLFTQDDAEIEHEPFSFKDIQHTLAPTTDLRSEYKEEKGWDEEDEFTFENGIDDEDLPGWLSEFSPRSASKDADEEETDVEKQVISPAFTADELDEIEQKPPTEPEPKEAQPLPVTAVFTSETREEISPTDDTLPFLTEDLPDWLTDLKPSELDFAEDEIEAEGPQKFTWADMDKTQVGKEIPTSPFEGEYPEESGPIPDLDFQPEQADESEKLEAGEMPQWLKAMKPIDSSIAGAIQESEAKVVASGPLKGLKGVLPAEQITTKIQKPPVYSVKLDLSEKQKTHSSLLENLVIEGKQSRKLTRESILAPRRLVRLLIALVLIAVVLLPLINPANTQPGATSPTTPILDFHNTIQELPNEKPVLLVMDYHPGFSGEMGPLSELLTSQLMSKGTPIATLSTLPAGPVLAAQTLETVQTSYPAYQLSEKTVNMGYLAGGLASLQAFAQRPQLTTQYGLDPAVEVRKNWSRPALQSVKGWSDFGAILLITDNVEVTRAWVEQVEPIISGANVPMFVAASAQAEPMIMPYVTSGQLEGALFGLRDSALYGSIVDPYRVNSARWQAYQNGVLLAAALIGLGIFLKFVTLIATRKEVRGEA
jgi:hypothetical protein